MRQEYVKQVNSDVIVKRYFRGWRFIHNYDHVVNGRVWVLWKNLVNVQVLEITAQSITLVLYINNRECCITFIYGANDGAHYCWKEDLATSRRF